MTRNLLVILFLAGALSSSIAGAGERLQVVVNELDANGVSRSVARVVSDHLRVKLIETRRFVIPERDKMEAILEEQAVGLELSECLSQECAVEIGRLMQANKMIVGTVSLLNETYSISVRFLDVETGTAEFSAEEKCQSSDDLYLAAEVLAGRVVAFVPQRGHVTAVSDENVIVNLGRVDGVTPGMKFTILREVERVQGYPEEQRVMMASVTSVQEAWSRLEPDREDDPASFMRSKTIQVGDIVVARQSAMLQELPEYGYLTVYSQPVGAEVYVDNLFRGRTEKNGLEVRVSAARHVVRVTAVAHKSDEREVELRSGERMPYNATLEPVVPRTRYRLPIFSMSYLRQDPGDETFHDQLDKSSLIGGQVSFGTVSPPVITEFGGTWTYANMASGKGYGVNEVHRLSGYGQFGIAFRWGMFLPYGGVGYEFGQLMFNENNVFDADESIGSAGKIDHDGWYWTAGVFVKRWFRIGYRSTWGRSNTDLTMLTVGLNLAGR